MECSIIIDNSDTNSPFCRVCLSRDSENVTHLLSLFEKYNGMFINDKINYIVNIEMKKGDDLPDKICFTCLELLENAYKFKITCEESNKILHSSIIRNECIYNDPKSVKVKEELLVNEHDDEGGTSLSELHYDDIKLEYEFADLNDQNQQSDFEEPINDVSKLDNIPRISKAIDLHLECHDCGEFFRTKCKLRVHWKKAHMLSQLFCPKCKKSHKSYKALHAHLRKKTKQCIFASKLKIVGTGKSRVYHCNQCDYNSRRIGSLMAHMVLHSGERAYSCEYCGKAFTQQGSLTVHQENIHKTKIVEVTCHQCGKQFVGRGKLYTHMKTHTNSQFPCQVCGKFLKTKVILKQHMIRHGDIKAYSCNICSKTFYTASDFANHREKVHIKSKLYQCDRCSYETRNHGCISKHKKKHTDTNVACDICGMFVENIQQLAFHKLRHNKNLECMHCHKMFYRQKNLQSHLRCKHNIRQSSNKSKQKNNSDDSDN